jgi:hypothetical protein
MTMTMNDSIVLELDYNDFEIVRQLVYVEQFQSDKSDEYIKEIKELYETLEKQSRWNINQSGDDK